MTRDTDYEASMSQRWERIRGENGIEKETDFVIPIPQAKAIVDLRRRRQSKNRHAGFDDTLHRSCRKSRQYSIEH